MKIPHLELQVDLGARYLGNGVCGFRVWAPLLDTVAVRILPPEPRLVPMQKDAHGYWSAIVQDLHPGARYLYLLDGKKERPDPASRFQPDGVHGPSQIVDPDGFNWDDDLWKGMALSHLVIYELHTGTFTREGTFGAAVSRLDYLRSLGITAIEIMPVAQFPGVRNWGYDGVYPFAPQNSYGGPEQLKALVNACHRKGIAVILDVVYNHLGPDGNYLGDFGPYFTGKYKTPWGDAVNFDGSWSDEVRKYFTDNALCWLSEYHLDGLRLDAVDTIYDFGARHFLAELAKAVHVHARETGRSEFLIAESDLNDVRIISPAAVGGYGIDAQWNDDFHHALHGLLTGEDNGYYRDFGRIDQLEKSFREGFVYSGQYSRYRNRRHGNSSQCRPAQQFVVCSQNHDQIGNRMFGERLATLASFEQLKLAAACVILSPSIPLLFMGEEYGEKAPFRYFVDHIDERLIQAVRKGRTEEFAHFEWMGEVPDPQDENTFLCSKINPDLSLAGAHKILFDYYSFLIRVRKSVPALAHLSREDMETASFEREQAILLRRRHGPSEVCMLFSFNREPAWTPVKLPSGNWQILLESASPLWGGAAEPAPQFIVSNGEEITILLNPHSVLLYERNREQRP